MNFLTLSFAVNSALMQIKKLALAEFVMGGGGGGAEGI